MRFLQRNKANKTIIVISDLHLGAGAYIHGKRNFLEDFHHDKELVEFLDFYSSGEYSNREVELIINGDFLDFLAVPFVSFFDDEFWSEDASLKKLELIKDAHPEVFSALSKFIEIKNKSIVYIIGNHDGELVLEKVREGFISYFDEKVRERVRFHLTDTYIPVEGVVIKHGHQYEMAHDFEIDRSVIKSGSGKSYFIPPWGSYYVMRVVNKYKEERDYINQIRPIKHFLISGLIFDTLFTLRFIFANVYYFVMVRFLEIYQNKVNIKEFLKRVKRELQLFKNYETLTRSFFYDNDVKALIVGHTHEATYKTYADGSIFVNTGTWMKNVNLDFSKNQSAINLTYAQIDIYPEKKKPEHKFEHIDVTLQSWKGSRSLPYIVWS